MKVDTQMEAKLPTCYLLSARVFFPSASVAKIWVIRNLRRIQFAVQEEQLYAECGARLKNFRSSNIYCICPSLFKTPILTRQNIASTKNSQEFLASQVSVLRRNKATNSSTSNRPYFSCTEIPCTW